MLTKGQINRLNALVADDKGTPPIALGTELADTLLGVPVRPIRSRQPGALLLASTTFPSLTGFTFAGGTAALDTAVYHLGTSSLKVTSDGNSYVRKANMGFSADCSAAGAWLEIIYYLPAALSAENSKLAIYVYAAGNEANYAQHWVPNQPAGLWTAGWHVYRIPLATAGQGAYAANLAAITGFGVQWAKPATQVVYVNSVRIYAAGTDLPTFILTFDDGLDEHATVCAPYLQQYGWSGTFGIVANRVGNTGYATVDQIRTMDARGHAIANHSYSHTDWTNLTGAEKEFQVREGKRFLVNNGLGRNADVYVFAYGLNGTQADLDMTFRYSRCALNTAWLDRSLAEAAWPGPQRHPFAVTDRSILCRYLQDNHGTYGFTNANIDASITAGGVTPVMFHQLDGSAGFHTEADWKSAIDHLRTKELAGLCKVIGLTEWLDG
jgi:peptidoglycan/xylan/chitin deacetylase (PgdA/CDA1 family)